MGRLRDLMDGYYRTLDGQGPEAASRYWSPTCDFVAPGARGRGPEFIKDYIQAFYDGSPDLQHTVRRSVEVGSTITLELDAHGSNTGSLRLPTGEVPATGRERKVSACVVVQVRDGRFVSYHIYADMADFLAQLDLLQLDPGGPCAGLRITFHAARRAAGRGTRQTCIVRWRADAQRARASARGGRALMTNRSVAVNNDVNPCRRQAARV